MNSSSGSLAGEEFRGLGLEVVVLPLQDRDHVPGHVLEDLGVLKRAALGGDGNWLHCETSWSGRSARAAFDSMPPARRY